MSDSLARLQNAIARLVTDDGITRAYGSAPGETIAAVAGDGGAGVREGLLGLAVPDVVRYAAGLRRKRWDDVAATVPLSARVVGRLGARYEAWLGAHPARARADVLSPGAAEALRALPALTRELARDPGEAPWAAELLAFEVLGACSRADGHTRGFVARNAVQEIVEELRAGLIPVDPVPASHRYAFDGRGVRWWRLG